MGFVVGIASAIFFAISSIMVRVGQRYRAGDDGVLMTVFVNVLALGSVALFVTAPPWNTAGVTAMLLSGLIGTVLGRTAALRSVRLIGPTRSSAFITGIPAVAAVVGWLVLGERLTLVEAFGGALVLAGLLWLVRVRAGASGGSNSERVQAPRRWPRSWGRRIPAGTPAVSPQIARNTSKA